MALPMRQARPSDSEQAEPEARGRDPEPPERPIRHSWIALLVISLVFVPSADAGKFLWHRKNLSLEQKVNYFRLSVRHERQVIAFLRSPHAPRTLERHTELRWHQAALRWHSFNLRHYSSKLAPPPRPVDLLRAYAGPCLAQIIDNEGSDWNPTAWNTQGSGAYGLPQALPGSKMASAGPDWATNPYTQIRWLRGYAVSRYGSECGALAFWNAHRWY